MKNITLCLVSSVLVACGSGTTTQGTDGDPASGDPGGSAGDTSGGGDTLGGDTLGGDTSGGDTSGGGGDAGPCGIDCDLAIPNGTGTCDLGSTPPSCVVDACDVGFIQLDDTVCAAPPDVSCKPCTDDSDCYGGTCTTLGGDDVCVGPCDGGTCATGYGCVDVAGNNRCVPTSGTCSCLTASSGQSRACEITNSEGTCFGLETCDPASGWTGCTAATPEPEDCDGVDNDCNGQVDDGVTEPVTACEVTNGFGTCTDSWVCEGSVGWTCSAMTPVAEECDGEDNDCGGDVDEDFKDANGYYVDDEHCGACGLTCTGAIANGTSTCVENSGRPRCEVDQCVLGHEQVGPLTCLPAAGQLCSDCIDSDDCAVAGDECLSSVEGDFCAQDCSAGNAHGTPQGECPAGFTCIDLGGGSEQCMPDSGACSCQVINDDETRPCESTNSFGTCAGVETCHASTGWDACNAPDPEAEDCDGNDNDCNMLIDDALPAGAACTSTNTYGICDGTEVCAGTSGWVCDAPDAQPEICDHQDNNCSGQADEDFADLFDGCSAGQGICERFGFMDCNAAGTGTECNATAGTPDTEVCDGLDNDCMGDVDEDALWDDRGTPCAVGDGVCEAVGILICNTADPAGPVVCSATPGSGSAEICDGLDNNCMGGIDEGWSTKGDPCVVGLGACEAAGVLVCNAGDPSGPVVCSATPGADDVETCNGIDDDCDGVPDDVDGASIPPCTNQTGVCNGSQQRCGGSSGWLACTGNDYGPLWEPVEITCDDFDNDCDGDTDADDADLPINPCMLQDGVCAGSTALCATGMWQPCDGTRFGANYEANEATCDGLDNDCDGDIDGSLVGALCVNQAGECAGSRQRCGGTAGWLSCSGADYSSFWEPVEVTCDGRDNDCDGDTDADDADLPANPCMIQTGVCAGSTAVCSGGMWQPCDGTQYGADYEAIEVTCDHLDNDCNGTTDDPFVNGFGIYDTDTACGNCYTDCTAIYAKPNASGYCDATVTPTCEMACDGGFYELNLMPNDGCEFELDNDAIYVSTTTGTDNGGCGLGPSAIGGGRYPCQSIGQGLARALDFVPRRSTVYVAAGAYFEEIDLVDGIDVLGGFNVETWQRDVSANQTTIVGSNTGGGHNKAVTADGISVSTTRFDGFTIFGESASASGLNSYAVYVRDCTGMLEITNNVIFAGNGGRGARGTTLLDGDDGVDGDPGAECIHTGTMGCSGSTGAGGGGGTSTCGVAGFAGGSTVCPDDCNATANGDGSGGVGTGGSGANDWQSRTVCDIDTCGNPNTGGSGSNGGDGGHGNEGGGCAVNVGGVTPAGEWLGIAGGDADDGIHGAGGAGGGAGGGLDDNDGCGFGDKLGGAGGGGGAGGCGGDGALGGGAGGGSFAIFVFFTGASPDLPIIAGNTITRGSGGDGGDGGMGGAGGLAGAGGIGGEVMSCSMGWALGTGGRGGHGGQGGHGGGGGGGCGGVSYGIYSYNHVGLPPWDGNNTFAGGGVSGAGGVGGPSLGNSGTDGAFGSYANTNF